MNASEAAMAQEIEHVFRTKPINPFEVWFKEDYKFAPQNSHYSEVTDCDPYRYQTNLAFLMGDLDTPEINCIKGTQLGISHVANGVVIYEPSVRGRNACMYLPINDAAMTYSDPMLKYALDCIPSIQDELLVESALKKDSTNTNKQKTLKKGQIHSRSMESASAFDQIQVSTVVQDEISRATNRVKKNKDEEGENPHDAAKSRMEGEKNWKHISFSSPNEAHICLINKLYLKSQVHLEEQFRCPHCTRYIGLDFGDKVASHGMRWVTQFGSDGERDNLATSMTAVYMCPCCQETFDHQQMIDQDQLTGELRNHEIRLDLEKRQYFYIDDLGECTGRVAPKPYSIGVRLPGMFSRTKTFQRGVYEFLEAVDSQKEGDNSKMVVFDKKYRAVAYVKKEELGHKTPHQFLMARFEVYTAECPDPVQFITGWWDLQNDWIQGMYVGWGYGEEAWLLKNIVKMGDPATTNSMDIIDTMRAYEFKKANGTSLRPRLTGIDSGDRPDLAYDMSIKLNRMAVIPTKGGNNDYGMPLINFPKNPKPNCSNTFMTNIGTHSGGDLYTGRLKVELKRDDDDEAISTPGYIHLPVPDGQGMGDNIYNAEAYLDQHDQVDEMGRPFSNGMSEEICKQMVAEVEVVERGKLKYKSTRKRNEAWDCMIGNMAMIRIARLPKYGLRLKKYSETAASASAFQGKSDKKQKRAAKNWGQIGQ